MFYGSEKGQTSLFLLIVFVPLLMVSFLVIDAARMNAAEKQVEDAVRVASRSVLASYSSKIKEDYGLFVLGPRDGGVLEEELRRYIESNLEIENSGARGGGIRLYDYRIESLEAVPVFNLTDNEVTRQGILEYMKYRAPKSLVEGFIEKLDFVKKASEMSGVYKKKISMDRVLGDLDGTIAELKRCLEGWAGGIEAPVNSFNKNGSRDNLIDNIAESIMERRSLKSRLSREDGRARYLATSVRLQREYMEELNGEIALIQQQMNSLAEDALEEMQGLKEEMDELVAELHKGKERLESLENSLEDSREEADEIEDDISEAESCIAACWKKLAEDETLPYIHSNNKGLEGAEKAEELGEEITGLITELGPFLERETPGGSLVDVFREELETEIEKSCTYLFSQGVLESIKKSLSANIEALYDMKATLDTYDAMISNDFNLPGNREDIISLLKGGQEDYTCTISIKYDRVGGSREGEDPREGIVSGVREFFRQNVIEFNDIGKSGFNVEQLPSRKKVVECLPGSETGYEGNATELDNEVEFDESDEGFASGAFGFIAGLGTDIEEDILKLRDEIYINEYIIDTFYNAADREGRDRESFFNGEAEYVIHGMSSDRLNMLAARGEITLARFALNTLHVYMDGKKKALATSLATALAGWWTGGAGIPILSNMIMCSWGMGESILDVSKLLKGEKVPLYKTQADWQLDIGLRKGEKGSSAPGLGIDFDYEDYLRLFLLTVDGDKKTSRIEDIVCLNLYEGGNDWELWEYNTCIRVEAIVSVNYLFLPQMSIAKSRVKADGRKEFRVVVYEGY